MPRILKLVRHQNGSWQALSPAECDDPSSVLFENEGPAIDPGQLLGAFNNLLNPDGGVSSVDKANQFANVMKKFSKKLVSRCIYCNILKATEDAVLERILDEGIWTIINSWLAESKDDDNPHFLIELLAVCKKLPMSLDRLKENNTPKIVKGLAKFENDDVKAMSNDLVTQWMSIIRSENNAADAMKRKLRTLKENNKVKDQKKGNKQLTTVKEIKKEGKKAEKSLPPIPKLSPMKLKGNQRGMKEKERVKVEDYEDVKLKLDPEPPPKKPKIERPKTVKMPNTKFRMTGLEQEAPLPRKVVKKNAVDKVDKNLVLAAAKSAVTKRLSTTAPDRIMEKKIKPESLLNVNDSSAPAGGVKLIAAKPRPSHILYESASFMDALTAQPVAPLKRKKKTATKTPTTPPSPSTPTTKPPKLQFYKDTLEMNEDSSEKKKSDDKDEKSPDSPKDNDKDDSVNGVADESMEKSKEEEDDDETEVDEQECEKDLSVLKSILTHGKRRKRKKSVQWVKDEDLKEFFFFELDEDERVNVGRKQNFGDLKNNETKREREFMEAAKRNAGDKMTEAISWWAFPIPISIPEALVDPGCYSQEKERQYLRQQSSLQEIYFTKEMIPDTAHEPEQEIVAPQEPKIIPLDEENLLGSVVEFSVLPSPVTPLPDVLTSLMNMKTPLQISLEKNAEKSVVPSPTSPYDPGEPLNPSLLGIPPGMPPNFNGPRMNLPPEAVGIPKDWRPPPNMVPPPEAFFPPPGFPPQMMMMDPMTGGMARTPVMRLRMGAPGMMQPELCHPNMGKGAPFAPMQPRGGGGFRHRVPCRHFMANGCRFGNKCSFLHPGVNGPPL